MARQKEKETEEIEKNKKAGKLTLDDLRKMVNVIAKSPIAHNLSEEDLSVKEWIPTGSTWLDSIICRGKKARSSCFKDY